MFLLTLLIFFTTNRATGFSNDGSLTHSRGYTLSSHVVRDISAGLNIDCSTCPETRTVPQLLWTCASTLILATWVSVHPNVPPRGASMLRAATLRVGAMLMTILAPEMTLVWAFQEWWWAREVLRRVKENCAYMRQIPFLGVPDDHSRFRLDDDTLVLPCNGRVCFVRR